MTKVSSLLEAFEEFMRVTNAPPDLPPGARDSVLNTFYAGGWITLSLMMDGKEVSAERARDTILEHNDYAKWRPNAKRPRRRAGTPVSRGFELFMSENHPSLDAEFHGALEQMFYAGGFTVVNLILDETGHTINTNQVNAVIDELNAFAARQAGVLN